MISDSICCDYVMERIKTALVLLCPSLPSATTSKSLLKIRNRAIPSPLRLLPIEHHLLPPPCEPLHDPGQHLVQHPHHLLVHWSLHLDRAYFVADAILQLAFIQLFLSSHCFSKILVCILSKISLSPQGLTPNLHTPAQALQVTGPRPSTTQL